jgi:hypothetical protein
MAVERRGVVRPDWDTGRAGQFENAVIMFVIPSPGTGRDKLREESLLGFGLAWGTPQRDSSGQPQALRMTFGMGWRKTEWNL